MNIPVGRRGPGSRQQRLQDDLQEFRRLVRLKPEIQGPVHSHPERKRPEIVSPERLVRFPDLLSVSLLLCHGRDRGHDGGSHLLAPDRAQDAAARFQFANWKRLGT